MQRIRQIAEIKSADKDFLNFITKELETTDYIIRVSNINLFDVSITVYEKIDNNIDNDNEE